jgi:hypothetical protein
MKVAMCLRYTYSWEIARRLCMYRKDSVLTDLTVFACAQSSLVC